jgi:hypothetical protein
MGVKSHHMQVMKASFFGQSEEPQQYINNNDMRPREFRLRNKSVLNSTGFDEFDGKSIHERPIYSPIKTKSMTIYPEPPSRDDTRTVKERRIGLIILLSLYFTTLPIQILSRYLYRQCHICQAIGNLYRYDCNF